MFPYIFFARLSYREAGKPSTDAAVYTADDFGISDRHVFAVISKLSETQEYESRR